MLANIIVFSLIGGVFSLIGAICLLYFKKEWSGSAILTLVSFAAGVLIAVSLTDLLPEAISIAIAMDIEPRKLLFWTMASISGFFLFERSFFWFHHHHGPHHSHPDPVVPLVWVSDTLHNFIDGLVIAASFFVSFPLGIQTTIAVAAHEIPQEIADFSLFLSRGLSKTRVIIINILSSLATLAGALLAYFNWNRFANWQPYLLAFTAGMFLYIALSDLIPELHRKHERKFIWSQTSAFFIGIFVMLLVGTITHE